MILSSEHPSAWAWLIAALGLAAYTLPAIQTQLQLRQVRWCLISAWVLHGILAMASLSSGRFGFGPALSLMAWLVLSVYGIESKLYPHLQNRRVLAVLGGVAMALGLWFPGNALPAGAAWLPLHGALGMAAYGMLAAATVHAWLMQRSERQIRLAQGADTGLPLLTLERLMMSFVWMAFILLSLTLLAGALFTESVHGTGAAWKWNHKTVFSLLAWLILAVLLVGRRLRGWRGQLAARWVYVGAICLLLAYVGSRFVTEMLLQRTAS
jgi:ABC-type uncharacterized transport system permease subunit